MIENYIVINGKKAELTEEQMKALGIEVKKDPLARVESGERFYWIAGNGVVTGSYDTRWPSDEEIYNVANYCTDKALMEQRALHETLNRLLWRYSMQHDGEKIDWDINSDKWRIYYDRIDKGYVVKANFGMWGVCSVYFHTAETAEAAIEEVVKPFMEQHPEFKW